MNAGRSGRLVTQTFANDRQLANDRIKREDLKGSSSGCFLLVALRSGHHRNTDISQTTEAWLWGGTMRPAADRNASRSDRKGSLVCQSVSRLLGRTGTRLLLKAEPRQEQDSGMSDACQPMMLRLRFAGLLARQALSCIRPMQSGGGHENVAGEWTRGAYRHHNIWKTVFDFCPTLPPPVRRMSLTRGSGRLL
jgi:hypothetical protein